jgi:hypothetical protein
MPGMLDKIKQFSRSPQGRRAAEQVRRASADPRRREQARHLLGKLRGRLHVFERSARALCGPLGGDRGRHSRARPHPYGPPLTKTDEQRAHQGPGKEVRL